MKNILFIFVEVSDFRGFFYGVICIRHFVGVSFVGDTEMNRI